VSLVSFSPPWFLAQSVHTHLTSLKIFTLPTLSPPLPSVPQARSNAFPFWLFETPGPSARWQIRRCPWRGDLLQRRQHLRSYFSRPFQDHVGTQNPSQVVCTPKTFPDLVLGNRCRRLADQGEGWICERTGSAGTFHRRVRFPAMAGCESNPRS